MLSTTMRSAPTRNTSASFTRITACAHHAMSSSSFRGHTSVLTLLCSAAVSFPACVARRGPRCQTFTDRPRRRSESAFTSTGRARCRRGSPTRPVRLRAQDPAPARP